VLASSTGKGEQPKARRFLHLLCGGSNTGGGYGLANHSCNNRGRKERKKRSRRQGLLFHLYVVQARKRKRTAGGLLHRLCCGGAVLNIGHARASKPSCGEEREKKKANSNRGKEASRFPSVAGLAKEEKTKGKAFCLSFSAAGRGKKSPTKRPRGIVWR